MTTVLERTDLTLPETVTRPGPGQHFALFSWEYVRHTTGIWAGQRFILEPFQRDFADELFKLGPDGKRVYREAILGIPRKNGKSTLAAAIGLYLLIADGEQGPQVYIAAASKKQARIVFDETKKFIRRSSGLQDFVRPYRDTIICPDNDGKIEVVSSDAPLQHGLNPSGNVIDELHAHPDADLYDALTSGSGAREQPLTVTISTAGVDMEGPLGEIYQRMIDREDAEHPTPFLTIARDVEGATLFWWYGAPKDARIDDELVWAGVNPATWITAKDLRTELAKPTMRRSTFRRLHLNQWTSSEEEWIPPEVFAACRFGDHPLDDAAWLHGLDLALPVAVAVDVGLKHDYASVMVVQRQARPVDPADPDRPLDRFVSRKRSWHNPFPEDHREHDDWELDIAIVREQLRSLRATFEAPAAINADTKWPHPGPAFVYDPWKFKESAQILRGEGLNMIEFPQYDRYMVPACTGLYELATTRRLEYDGDPEIAAHVANAVGVERDRGWRIQKPKRSKKHIDNAITLAMGTAQAAIPPPPVYKSKPRAAVGW